MGVIDISKQCSVLHAGLPQMVVGLIEDYLYLIEISFEMEESILGNCTIRMRIEHLS